MNLDCESLELAEESLAAILRVSLSEMRRRVDNIKHEDFEIRTDTKNDRLLPMLRAVAGRKVEDLTGGRTYWLHATRTGNFESFREGIRSLPNNFDRIWDFLHSLVTDCVTVDGWENFRRETEESNYGGHLPDVIRCWKTNLGPYAFLFADSALNPRDTCNRDYLGASELVDFIASCFEKQFRVSLLDRYRAATRPALIKFATIGIKAVDLGAALNYVLHRTRNWSLCCVDPCFSGDGHEIAPNQLLKAIPVLESTRRFGTHIAYSLYPTSAHVSLRPGGPSCA